MPLTDAELAAIIEGIVVSIRGHVDEKIAALSERIQVAEKSLAERPGMRYLGTWDAGASYMPGDCATSGGSIWICREATATRPGASPAWQLAVKRGKDAR